MSDFIVIFNRIKDVITGSPDIPPSPPGADALLLETGDYLLLETGDKLLLE